MKIKDGFMLREVASQAMVVAVGEASKNFNGIIRLNSTGKFLWELMQNDISEQELVEKMISEYDVDEDTAKKDIDVYLEILRGADLLEK